MDLFSSLLLGSLGTATMQASTIGPFGAEKPFGGRDGLGIGLCIVKTQSQNRPKRNTIPDLKLQLTVRPVGAGIQNHNLEPESNINRLSAGIGLWLLVSNGRQGLAKLLPVKKPVGLRINPWIMS